MNNLENYSSSSEVSGYWIHKTTGVKTVFTLSESFISNGKMSTPSWKNNASEINVPSGVTEFTANCLKDSPDLVTLILPKTFTKFGDNSLSNTSKLTNLYVYSVVPPIFGVLGTYIGNNYTQVKVPAEAYDAYRTANIWTNFGMKLFVLNNLTPGSRFHSGYTQYSNTPMGGGDQHGIIIEGIDFEATMHEGNPYSAIVLWGSSNIIIRNCRFRNMLKNRAIYLLQCSNITIYNCDFDNIHAGINFAECTGGIRIFNNDFKNILGKLNGADEYGQAVQSNKCTGSNYFICDNAIENIQNVSSPEDNINIFASNFDAGASLVIKNNWLRGGGPSDSGGGIIIGDHGGSNMIVEKNILVNPGQYGIGIAGGANCTLQGNKVYGAQLSWSNVGLVAANWTPEIQPSQGWHVGENHVHWTNKVGAANDYWVSESDKWPTGWNTNVFRATDVGTNMLPTQIIGV